VLMRRDKASYGRGLRSRRHHDLRVLSFLSRGHTTADRRMASLLLRDPSLASQEADTHQRQTAVPQGVHVADADVPVNNQSLPQRNY